jgi:hypothetical protein
MAISKAYRDTLKKRVLSRFIRDNGRAPTRLELDDIVTKEQQAYSSVDQIGISGFDIHKPGYREVSSANAENTNRQAIFDDMFTINTRLNDLVQLLEDSFRGFQGTARRTHGLLRQIEGRVNNLLLLNSDVDVFVHGVEETFDSQEHIDIENTTASVEANYCTLGRGGYTPVPLDDVRIVTTTTSEHGIIGSQASSDINLLKSDDGTCWEYLAYTKRRQGRVSLLMELQLPRAMYVGDLRVMGAGIAVNQQMTVTVFYSLDGQTFTALEPIEQVFNTDENVFNLGIDGVKKIQLLFSKNVSDNETPSGDQFVYVFSFDSIKIFSDFYTDDKSSVLIAGPYTVTDEQGVPVNFTKATLKACTVMPENTSVNFYLSKDKVNWVPISITDKSSSVVSFADGSKTGTELFIDSSLSPGLLVEEVEGIEEIDFETEALLNTAVSEEYSRVVPLASIVLKRNVRTLTSPTTLYGTSPGWFFNSATSQYTTTVKVEAPEGRYIDVGASGLFVNGKLQTGLVKLQKGYSTIATDDGNWRVLPEGLSTVDLIIDADPLYPYNHKYLIEGYQFPAGFKGDKVYTGVDEYFGMLLKYVSPESFSSIEEADVTTFGSYTIEDVDGNLYFKVKVQKTDASWKEEQYEIDWAVQSDETSDVYVKAVLATSESKHSPIIKNFSIRVI